MPKISELINTCTGCLACYNICPRSAIDSIYDAEGFIRPKVDVNKCVECSLCERVCHVLHEREEKGVYRYKGFIARSNDEKVLRDSSSGGLFYELASSILLQSGVIYAAHFNYHEKKLEHSSTDQYELLSFLKSKYIESNTGYTFSLIEKELRQNRKVLFCGTPCQVSGLKSYLATKKCDFDNIVFIDFFCHGVPSAIHYSEWLSFISKRLLNNEELVYLDFRNKDNGWLPFNVVYQSSKKRVSIPYYEDLESYAFYDNLALRRSCSDCREIFYHNSDITLGDYRGKVEDKSFDDNKGISLAIINSKKGRNLLEQLIDKSRINAIPIDSDLFSNAYHKKPSELFSLSRRERNLKMIKRVGYVNTLILQYGYKVMAIKIKRWIKRILK